MPRKRSLLVTACVAIWGGWTADARVAQAGGTGPHATHAEVATAGRTAHRVLTSAMRVSARRAASTQRATLRRNTTPPRTKKRKPAQHTTTKRKSKAGRASNMPNGFSWPPTAVMRARGKACMTDLAAAQVAFSKAEAQKRVPTPITVDDLQFSGVRYAPTWRKGPFVMDCHLALALTQHSAELHALGVREIHFSRIYGYTKVRTGGRSKNVLSRHALGMAMDIYEIVDVEGTVHVVKTDYARGDEFLRRVENALNASGGFRTVLSPQNDPRSHDDHFHIEAAVNYGKPLS